MFISFLTPFFIQGALAAVNIIDKGLVPLVENSAGLQFYADIENDDRIDKCLVRTSTWKCCLTDSEKEDCDAMTVYGYNYAIIAPRDTQTLVFVYPTLYQHDLIGFCDFTLNQRCGKERNKKEVIRIPFDTTVTKDGNVLYLLKDYIGTRRIEQCSFFDEDSLNDCDPVDCNQKYSGNRPFYDDQSSKCKPAVKCFNTIFDDLPDVAFVPKSNICRNLNKPFTREDIAEISRGYAVTVTIEPQPDTHTEGLKLLMTSNCSTISQNLHLIRDMILGKFTSLNQVDKSDYKDCLKLGFFKIFVEIIKVSACILFVLFFIMCLSCIQPSELWAKWKSLKQKIANSCYHPTYKVSHVNTDLRDSLLREVIVRDIPLELRDSAVNICSRINNETRWKKRYRQEDIGSQVSLQYATSETSSDSDDNESSKLLK